jgi:hypothetical protein
MNTPRVDLFKYQPTNDGSIEDLTNTLLRSRAIICELSRILRSNTSLSSLPVYLKNLVTEELQLFLASRRAELHSGIDDKELAIREIRELQVKVHALGIDSSRFPERIDVLEAEIELMKQVSDEELLFGR